MIVTSKRCFLNVVTQLCDAQTLLNANYYISDIKSPTNEVNLNDQYSYNEQGDIVYDSNVCSVNNAGTLSRYNITYSLGGDLDPTRFITQATTDLSMNDPVKRFVQHLNSSETFVAVYDDLFSKRPRGNGLQIIIFTDDNIIDVYVDIVCKWLSHNFGTDITFIDPQYRPNIHGSLQYVGNKINAQQVIPKVRDIQLMIKFEQMLTASGYNSSLNNLTVFLDSFNPPQLIHLYNLLFPNDPLPPDNYTVDHIKHIIIERSMQNTKKDSFENLFTLEDFENMFEEYNV